MTSTLICVPTTPTAMHVPGTAIGLPDPATTVTVADLRRMSGLVEQYAALVPLPMHEVVRRLMWVELRAAEAGETGAEQGVRGDGGGGAGQ
jgi:hypothetical protein